jgi:extracellular factor (EF) 3-hydroxypalmitic acid methyl ester biosynthesis protein
MYRQLSVRSGLLTQVLKDDAIPQKTVYKFKWFTRAGTTGCPARRYPGDNMSAQLAFALRPSESIEALQTLHAWLRDLAASERVGAPPTRRDTRTLDRLLEDLWQSAVEAGDKALVEPRFRSTLNPFFLQSPTLRRTFEKPRGYAGDYLMMEALYRDTPEGDTSLALWMDEWALALPGFEAVRFRRRLLADLLRAEHARGARRVFSVACGSAGELADTANLDFESIDLLDQDAEAIQAATRGLLEAAGSQRSPRVRVWPQAIRALFRPNPAPLRDPHDVIYSMGLYDYLQAPTARRLTEHLWSGLKPGGLLAIGNFNDENPMHHFIEVALDWHLVYRNPHDLLALTQPLEDVQEAQVLTDPHGCLHLLVARKKA